MVIVGKHINGITINPLEYILDDSGKEMEFASIEAAKVFLKEQGFTDDDIEWLVFETVPASGEGGAALDKAVEYIIKKCADETESGTCYIHADDFPADILPPHMFAEHISNIVALMTGYVSVAEATVEDDSIFIIMYLNYCPNYAPTPEETSEGKFPDNRVILDPLTKVQFADAYIGISKIEDLLNEAGNVLNRIPPVIQQSILKYHNESATIQHCIRWGMQAAKEIRTDWHTVAAGVPCKEAAKGAIDPC